MPDWVYAGGIAIEDAASLAVLFPRDTSPDDVPERLALYEKIRDERAHKVQQFTRQAGMDLNDSNRGNFNMMEFMQYNFGHDEWHNSTRVLREHLWSRNAANVRWRAPLSFGPSPSPRQDHYGRPIPSHDAQFTTYSVRFRSSATYLKTLFPRPEFSFARPGTVAQASFKCTELRDMRWLGGGGYRFLGLWIHGVQYTRKTDGSTVHGSFLAVLFESLADPILTGRDELGMPKVFCDIDVEGGGPEGKGETSIQCSWRGTPFLRMLLGALQEDDGKKNDKAETAPPVAAGPVGPPPKEEGTLVYRYVPAVGKPGQADAEYAVLMREGEAAPASSTPRVLEKTSRSEESRIEFVPTDWQSLPTLHHIVSGLAEIPVYEIVEAKVEEGHGVDDLSNAERLE
jgi:hypothetical protein